MQFKKSSLIIGNKRLVEESDIPNLPYLQAIVKETLRLHPGAPLLLRESSKDCIGAGYHIPAKTRLFINVWAICRDPNHWQMHSSLGKRGFSLNMGMGKGSSIHFVQRN
ncbi:cytochrome P450 [Perilla frutescens var. frutescens]|nr:cytochrome P450 [Perilla frutescens var. frutescens]